MAITFEQQKHERTASKMTISGGILIFGAILVALYGIIQHENKAVGSTASYTAHQQVKNTVNYYDNSFFGSTPRSSSDAYISSLTQSLTTRFQSTYTLTKPANLDYVYRVDVAVKGTYPMEGDTDKTSNVWQKDYVLVPSTKRSDITDVLSVSQDVKIPYAEYKKDLDEFKKTLNVPVSGEVFVNMTLQVDGSVDGVAFHDSQSPSMTVPLTEEIYQPAYKYDKERQGTITPEQSKSNQDNVEKVLLGVSVLLAFSGVGLVVYGLRGKIFKSPYHRELDRIYRYHEGMIVRARRHPDILHKTVVPVQSFDDIVNLEEELRSPIISSEAGDSATRFMIIRGDEVYMYVLGILPPDDAEVMQEIEQAFTKKSPALAKKPVVKPRIIQQ